MARCGVVTGDVTACGGGGGATMGRSISCDGLSCATGSGAIDFADRATGRDENGEASDSAGVGAATIRDGGAGGGDGAAGAGWGGAWTRRLVPQRVHLMVVPSAVTAACSLVPQEPQVTLTITVSDAGSVMLIAASSPRALQVSAVSLRLQDLSAPSARKVSDAAPDARDFPSATGMARWARRPRITGRDVCGK